MIGTADVGEAAPQELVDPRVARVGGSRRDRKANYDFPGMMDAASWRRTEVHKHTHWYGCSLCGQKFAGPRRLYPPCQAARRTFRLGGRRYELTTETGRQPRPQATSRPPVPRRAGQGRHADT